MAKAEATTTSTKLTGCSVRPCNCAHTGQDALHGKGQRVHNHGGKDKSNAAMICTVCGTRKRL